MDFVAADIEARYLAAEAAENYYLQNQQDVERDS